MRIGNNDLIIQNQNALQGVQHSDRQAQLNPQPGAGDIKPGPKVDPARVDRMRALYRQSEPNAKPVTGMSTGKRVGYVIGNILGNIFSLGFLGIVQACKYRNAVNAAQNKVVIEDQTGLVNAAREKYDEAAVSHLSFGKKTSLNRLNARCADLFDNYRSASAKVVKDAVVTIEEKVAFNLLDGVRGKMTEGEGARMTGERFDRIVDQNRDTLVGLMQVALFDLQKDWGSKPDQEVVKAAFEKAFEKMADSGMIAELGLGKEPYPSFEELKPNKELPKPLANLFDQVKAKFDGLKEEIELCKNTSHPKTTVEEVGVRLEHFASFLASSDGQLPLGDGDVEELFDSLVEMPNLEESVKARAAECRQLKAILGEVETLQKDPKYSSVKEDVKLMMEQIQAAVDARSPKTLTDMITGAKVKGGKDLCQFIKFRLEVMKLETDPQTKNLDSAEKCKRVFMNSFIADGNCDGARGKEVEFLALIDQSLDKSIGQNATANVEAFKKQSDDFGEFLMGRTGQVMTSFAEGQTPAQLKAFVDSKLNLLKLLDKVGGQGDVMPIASALGGISARYCQHQIKNGLKVTAEDLETVLPAVYNGASPASDPKNKILNEVAKAFPAEFAVCFLNPESDEAKKLSAGIQGIYEGLKGMFPDEEELASVIDPANLNARSISMLCPDGFDADKIIGCVKENLEAIAKFKETLRSDDTGLDHMREQLKNHSSWTGTTSDKVVLDNSRGCRVFKADDLLTHKLKLLSKDPLKPLRKQYDVIKTRIDILDQLKLQYDGASNSVPKKTTFHLVGHLMGGLAWSKRLDKEFAEGLVRHYDELLNNPQTGILKSEAYKSIEARIGSYDEHADTQTKLDAMSSILLDIGRVASKCTEQDNPFYKPGDEDPGEDEKICIANAITAALIRSSGLEGIIQKECGQDKEFPQKILQRKEFHFDFTANCNDPEANMISRAINMVKFALQSIAPRPEAG